MTRHGATPRKHARFQSIPPVQAQPVDVAPGTNEVLVVGKRGIGPDSPDAMRAFWRVAMLPGNPSLSDTWSTSFKADTWSMGHLIYPKSWALKDALDVCVPMKFATQVLGPVATVSGRTRSSEYFLLRVPPAGEASELNLSVRRPDVLMIHKSEKTWAFVPRMHKEHCIRVSFKRGPKGVHFSWSTTPSKLKVHMVKPMSVRGWIASGKRPFGSTYTMVMRRTRHPLTRSPRRAGQGLPEIGRTCPSKLRNPTNLL